MVINCYEFSTKLGKMAIYFNKDGLYGLSFLRDKDDKNHNYISKNFKVVKKVEEDIYGYANEILKYINGEIREFSVPIKLFGTEFQRKVWNELINIPYGETRTYKDIANSIECPKGFRAVGGALNKNPIPIIIPCHRVIGSNGKLVGFAGGLELKEKLLKIEIDNKENLK